jgi:hypothetical protein
MNNPNDTLIATLKKEIQKQTAELGPKPKFVPVGDAIVIWNNKPTNLHAIPDNDLTEYIIDLTVRHETLDGLFRKYSSVGFEEKFENSLELLRDATARLQVLVWQNAKKKLDAKNAQLDKLLSAEAATALELQKIADSL